MEEDKDIFTNTQAKTGCLCTKGIFRVASHVRIQIQLEVQLSQVVKKGSAYVLFLELEKLLFKLYWMSTQIINKKAFQQDAYHRLTHHMCFDHQMSVPVWGRAGPQMNKSEQVSGDVTCQ